MKRILTTLLIGVFMLLSLIGLNTAQRRTAAAELALTETSLSAVAEASTELDTLVLALDKLLVTTSPRQMAKLLTQISISADRVQGDLAGLPDTRGQRAAILSYLSRLSQMAQLYLADLAEGDALDAESRARLDGMRADLLLLQAEMNFARADALTGTAADEALHASQVTSPPTAQELFTYKALPSREVGSGEALQLAKEFVGAERVASVQAAPDTAGALPAFGVTVQTADVQLNLEVTRRGGKVLLMAPETASFPMQRTPEQCSAAALAFLKERGFAEMEIPYYQVYDGLCVLTCVYVQDSVLVWADRVLVQVRMDTAEVVGIEARSYWKNHIPRRLQTPLLTQTEASASLSRDAQVESARLCLLPVNGQERTCWQFRITRNGESYISYIDAMNGNELLLEKIIQLEFGSTVA